MREGFQELDPQRVPSERGSDRQGQFHGQFTRLLARLDSLLADLRNDFMFSTSGYTSSEAFKTYLGDMIGYGSAGKRVC